MNYRLFDKTVDLGQQQKYKKACGKKEREA